MIYKFSYSTNRGMSARAFKKPASLSASVLKNFGWLLCSYEQYKYEHIRVGSIFSFVVRFSVSW